MDFRNFLTPDAALHVIPADEYDSYALFDGDEKRNRRVHLAAWYPDQMTICRRGESDLVLPEGGVTVCTLLPPANDNEDLGWVYTMQDFINGFIKPTGEALSRIDICRHRLVSINPRERE